MADKKVILAATVVALTIFGAPIAASAAPLHSDKAQTAPVVHTEDHDDEGNDDGDDDKDDEHHGSIPPVFVVPGGKKHPVQHPPKPTTTGTDSTGTSGTASIDPVTGEEIPQLGPDGQPVDIAPGSDNPGGVAPEDARAVDITRVPRHMKTPADEFMDAAYLGLGLLAVSAVGLGVTAGVRAIRVRRGGKSDYIYNDK